MSTHTEQTSIRTEITVEVPIDRAFQVFVEDFARIKPREHNMLELHIIVLTHLTNLFVTHLLARPFGSILQIASNCALELTPLIAPYSPANAYVRPLSEACRYPLT